MKGSYEDSKITRTPSTLKAEGALRNALGSLMAQYTKYAGHVPKDALHKYRIVIIYKELFTAGINDIME